MRSETLEEASATSNGRRRRLRRTLQTARTDGNEPVGGKQEAAVITLPPASASPELIQRSFGGAWRSPPDCPDALEPGRSLGVGGGGLGGRCSELVLSLFSCLLRETTLVRSCSSDGRRTSRRSTYLALM